jgi:dephospho-CoA kinase
MAATVTLTGTAGAGVTVAATVFSEVSQITIDADKNMVTLVKNNQVVSPISVAAATTVTATKSGSTWTLTIS